MTFISVLRRLQTCKQIFILNNVNIIKLFCFSKFYVFPFVWRIWRVGWVVLINSTLGGKEATKQTKCTFGFWASKYHLRRITPLPPGFFLASKSWLSWPLNSLLLFNIAKYPFWSLSQGLFCAQQRRRQNQHTYFLSMCH